MTQAIETAGITRDDVERLSARFGEPDWLLQRRLEAWRLYEELPMPDPLTDEWKRFDVERLTLEGLSALGPEHAPIDGPAGLPEPLRSAWDEREELAGRLVQHDSDVVYRQLDDALAAKGVVLADLHTAAREHEALVREHLMSAVTPGEWKYLALHAALWSGGCFVYVPQGVEVELPIEYVTAMSGERLALFPHTLIVAEPNSKVTLIQEGLSPTMDDPNLISGAVEVIARQGAQVRFVDVQRWGRNVLNLVTMRANVSRDASVRPILLGLGGSVTRGRLDVALKEEAANAELLGLIFGDTDQHFYYDTRQDHVAPHTTSDLLFKAALDDRASIIWYGVVEVREEAGQAAANQTSRNLLLSDKASASPTPILEISAYDVSSCSHGATVGPVDQEQLFYLESRGIPHDEAERMLVEGFYAEVLERVPSERLQERVGRLLESKLTAAITRG